MTWATKGAQRVAALGACCAGVAAAVIGATAGTASPAGYPPPVTPTCVASIVSAPGTTLTVALDEPFTAGSTVALTLNSASYGNTTAPADGSALNLVIATTDPHLAINGGPATSVNYGNNTVVASGPAPSGGTQTCTVTIDVVSAGSSAAGSGTGVIQTASGTAGGASLGKSGAGSSFQAPAVGLAFTGADLALMVLAALLLLVLGAGLLGYGRRRRRHYRLG